MTDPTPRGEEQDERRLRALLRAAVPEAPEVTLRAPAPRRRGPVLAVLAAAAAVAAVVVVPLTLGGDDGDRTAVTLPEPTVERTPLPTDPYAVAPCRPGRSLGVPTRTRVPDLDGASAIRLCVTVVSTGNTPLDLSVPDDALVSGLGGLGTPLRELPDADPDACAAASYFDPTSIVVTTPDGEVTLSASPCSTLRAPGPDGDLRRVSAGAVADLVVEALGRQRSTSDYPRFSYSNDGAADWCDAPSTVAPVVPAESDLALAVLCPDYNDGRATPMELNGAALERLRIAWRETDTPSSDPGFDGYDDEMANIVALTSYGDLVRMVPKEGVDGLVLVVPRQGFGQPTAVVPISIDEVTD